MADYPNQRDHDHDHNPVLAGQSGSGLICHVNLARGFRGGERQTELLVLELSKRNVRQRLVARRGEPLAAHCAGVPGLDVRESAGSPLAVLRHAGGASVVHVHEGRSVHLASLRHNLLRTPYVITRRVDNPIRKNRAVYRAYRNASEIIVVSSAVQRELLKLDPSLACRVIPDASSDLRTTESGARNLREKYQGKLLVGHIGALDHSHKGQLNILEAAADIERTHPQIQFVLLGQGRDDALFREKAAQLNNVDLVGFVDNVGDYLVAFDIFVFPSLHEGLGSVLIDAMEYALPIVATRVGGIPDLITDDDNGLLVPPGDSESLRRTLLSLVDDPVLAQRLGDRGREIARDYTPERMAERYLDVYRPFMIA